MKKNSLFFIFLIVLIFLVLFFGKEKKPSIIPHDNVNKTITVTPVIFNQGKQVPIVDIPLQIDSPQNGSTVNSSPITIRGKTVALATVQINEKEIKADNEGNFSTSIAIDEGENNISIVANDQDGNYAEQDLTVMLETLQ